MRYSSKEFLVGRVSAVLAARRGVVSWRAQLPWHTFSLNLCCIVRARSALAPNVMVGVAKDAARRRVAICAQVLRRGGLYSVTEYWTLPRHMALMLSVDERTELVARVRSRTIRSEAARRARVALMLADGVSYSTIESTLLCYRDDINRWRRRFLAARLAGLESRHYRQLDPSHQLKDSNASIESMYAPHKLQTQGDVRCQSARRSFHRI